MHCCAEVLVMELFLGSIHKQIYQLHGHCFAVQSDNLLPLNKISSRFCTEIMRCRYLGRNETLGFCVRFFCPFDENWFH